MLRRSLFACALMLAGVVGFASSAKAGTATVQLGMTVPTSCSFGTNTPGVLQLGSSTTFTTATAATIGISCNGPATLQVANPALAISTTGTTTFSSTSATATTLTNKSVTSGASTLAINASDNGLISVSMSATASTAIQAGIYNFDVLLTSTP